MEFRQLGPADAAALRALQIRAVSEHPSAFSASPEEEAALTDDQVALRLSQGPPHTFALGALDAGRLVGIVNLMRYQRPKVRHKAMLGGMYVAPETQGRGVGRGLLLHTLAFARALAGLETITLAVTVGNAPARHLYASVGFIPYGIEPRYIRVDTRYYDIEWMYLHLTPPADAA
jgi:RimJ/RimL family protein N-acetyltransferase